MPEIRILSEQMANKIAAGEVIERPSSIVKELIENSIDARADEIHVAVKHGGKSFLRVSDNGKGMDPADAELAIKRHATSKISDARDLTGISTFGFRGEALPSIAAVSRFRLSTRTADQDTGTEIFVEGGKVTEVRETAMSKGTTIEVSDLFFNTPARRKFMRGDATELGHIQDTIQTLALAHPEIAFTFESSGRKTLEYPPVDKLRHRILQINGEETARHWVDIEADTGSIRIFGAVGKPYLARANRSGQSFFVNDRAIRSIPFSYALHAGYHGLMMHGQYPAAVLFVQVDPERVDVNIHPTKQEVRLSAAQEIHSLIKKTVAEALMASGDLSPSLSDPKENARPFQEGRGPALTGQKSWSYPVRDSSDADSQPSLHLSEQPGSFAVSIQEPLGEPLQIRDELKITKILGQIHHTFLLAETEEGYIVIDQHAAHERVMFEKLLEVLESGEPSRQDLLMDEILELHSRQTEVFRSHLSTLNRLGFEIEEFGENSFIVRSCPALLKDADPVAYLRRFAEEKESDKERTSVENIQEDAAAMIACKRKSVKAHDPMTPEAVRTLLTQLGSCKNPFSCPHGRPTFFKYTFSDLEKQFKRK